MLSTLLAVLALGQCSGGSCPAPMSFQPQVRYLPQLQYQPAPVRYIEPAPAPEAIQLQWKRIDYDGMLVFVYGEVLPSGNIRWDTKMPENIESVRKARATLAAKQPKPPEKNPVAEVENFGLDMTRVGKRVGYSGNVREYGQEGDSGKIFLTVIGTPQQRAEVVRDFKDGAEFAGLRDKVNFGEYNKGEWQVKDELGYYANGSPTILIQQPSGRVSWRAYDYSGGAEQLAQALRQSDPNYRPESDPGPHNKKPAPGSEGIPVEYILAGAVVLFLLMPRRAK